MREIKFRAWDKVEKRMRVVSFWDFVMGFLTFTDEEKEEISNQDTPLHQAEVNDCELMQFTGLLDKNGKEIYEGDIVKAWFPGMPNNMRATQEVMFVDGCFGCGDYPLKLIDKATVEILGNIYENPEFLNK